MSETAERYYAPSQEEQYDQFVTDYSSELAQVNQTEQLKTQQYVKEAAGNIERRSYTVFPAQSQRVSDRLQASAASRTKVLETATDRFYAIATSEDIQVLDTAASYFYNYDFETAYHTIDQGASSPHARRAMRTAMDRFTVDMLDGKLARSADAFEAGDGHRVKELYEFIRNFGSSDDANQAMFSKALATISEAVMTSRQASLPPRVERTVMFVEAAATDDTSRQALSIVTDSLIMKTARRSISEGRVAEAQNVVSVFSSQFSQEALWNFVKDESKRATLRREA